MNKTVAETMYANIKKVGLPTVERGRSDAGQGAAEGAGQRRAGRAWRRSSASCGGPSRADEDKHGGGSDDIGDISWNVPTVTLRYPANIPGLPGHNWANAIAMATPIAHKGVIAGAKVQAMTVLDLLTQPELVAAGVGLLQQRPDQGREVHPVHQPKDKPPAIAPERRDPRRSTASR